VEIELENDELIDVLIDTLPDMTTEELSDLEFAISVELQERASRVNPVGLFDAY
jgi:hypothetical protein